MGDLMHGEGGSDIVGQVSLKRSAPGVSIMGSARKHQSNALSRMVPKSKNKRQMDEFGPFGNVRAVWEVKSPFGIDRSKEGLPDPTVATLGSMGLLRSDPIPLQEAGVDPMIGVPRPETSSLTLLSDGYLRERQGNLTPPNRGEWRVSPPIPPSLANKRQLFMERQREK